MVTTFLALVGFSVLSNDAHASEPESFGALYARSAAKATYRLPASPRPPPAAAGLATPSSTRVSGGTRSLVGNCPVAIQGPPVPCKEALPTEDGRGSLSSSGGPPWSSEGTLLTTLGAVVVPMVHDAVSK